MLGQVLLPFKGQVSQIQLMAQTLFISRFQQSGTKCLVNFYGIPDDSITELIDIHSLTLTKGYYVFLSAFSAERKKLSLCALRVFAVKIYPAIHP